MTESINMVSRILCHSVLVASSSPSDFGYWIGGRYSGSLGLHWQVLAFFATIVLILWKSDEMMNKPMLVAGILGCVSLATFVCTGLLLPNLDARIVCFLLNGFQGLILVGLIIHWRMRTMSRF